jgi:hypothetical protein
MSRSFGIRALQASAEFAPLACSGDPPGCREDLVLPDAFNLNSEQDILLKSILLAVIHTEVSAIEGAHRVGAADLLLEHGVLKTFERIDAQSHGLGHAVKRQLTDDRLRGIAREFAELAFVFGGWELSDVQHFRARDVFVELVVSEVDAGRVDEDIHRAGLGGGIVLHLASGFLESAAPGGEAPEVIHFEAWVSVIGVQVISSRGGARRCGSEDKYGQ